MRIKQTSSIDSLLVTQSDASEMDETYWNENKMTENTTMVLLVVCLPWPGSEAEGRLRLLCDQINSGR